MPVLQGGMGRVQGTTACLGAFPSVSVDNRLEDHVMTDGNVLLQQHELVMNQLMKRVTNSLFQLLSTALL